MKLLAASIVRHPMSSRVRLVARWVVVLVASMAVATGCGFGGAVEHETSYWVLNDSAATVVVDVHEQVHTSWTVPAHTYGSLFVASAIGSSWTIRVVGTDCAPQASWPIDADHDLVYVPPSRPPMLVTGVAWSYGLGTAKGVTALATRQPPCP